MCNNKISENKIQVIKYSRLIGGGLWYNQIRMQMHPYLNEVAGQPR